jgi:hypothetical protein
VVTILGIFYYRQRRERCKRAAEMTGMEQRHDGLGQDGESVATKPRPAWRFGGWREKKGADSRASTSQSDRAGELLIFLRLCACSLVPWSYLMWLAGDGLVRGPSFIATYSCSSPCSSAFYLHGTHAPLHLSANANLPDGSYQMV